MVECVKNIPVGFHHSGFGYFNGNTAGRNIPDIQCLRSQIDDVRFAQIVSGKIDVLAYAMGASVSKDLAKETKLYKQSNEDNVV